MNNNLAPDKSSFASHSAVGPIFTTQMKPEGRTIEEKYGPGKEIRTNTIDLGSATGWTIMVGPEIRDSGTVILASEVELQQQRKQGKERTGDIRLVASLISWSKKSAPTR